MGDPAAQARAHAIFDPIAEEYLARPGVDIGPMFGSEGLRIRGKIFAFLGYDGNLIVKVPEARADELVAEAGVHRMVMRERPMREWVELREDAAALWQPVVAEAFAYLDDITA